MSRAAEIKRVGQSGQISLGKQFAGRLIRVETTEDGGFVLTPVVDVPESQLWTLNEPHRSRIERALAWAAKNPPRETDLDELLKSTGVEESCLPEAAAGARKPLKKVPNRKPAARRRNSSR